MYVFHELSKKVYLVLVFSDGTGKYNYLLKDTINKINLTKLNVYNITFNFRKIVKSFLATGKNFLLVAKNHIAHFYTSKLEVT